MFKKDYVLFFYFEDLEFHEAVYPIRVSIYEGYNPGYVTQIWAQDSNERWFLLWKGRMPSSDFKSRLFSPPLQFYDFKTKMLRLKFMYSFWDYCTHINAVLLIGTSELILSKKHGSLNSLLKYINHPNQFIDYSIYYSNNDNFTPNFENANLDILKLRQNFPKYCYICKRYYNHRYKVLNIFLFFNIMKINIVCFNLQRYSKEFSHTQA